MVGGVWTCEDLHSRPWEELVHVAWVDADVTPADLPAAAWACDMPPGSAAVFASVGLVVGPIACTQQLLAEARAMQNCLASSLTYFEELVAGESRIFSIKGQGFRATLQLVFGDVSWQVEQIFGPRNLPLAAELSQSPSAQWQAIRDFVDQFEEMPGPGAVRSVLP